MPWTRRSETVAWMLGTAMVVYGLFTYLILRQVMMKLVHVCGLGTRTSTTARPATGTYGEYLFGYFVPWWMILALWLILPGMFFGLETFYTLRRRHRDKHGCCMECGHKLRVLRGHCPGCGTRVGPGLPTRRYVLTMPRDA